MLFGNKIHSYIVIAIPLFIVFFFFLMQSSPANLNVTARGLVTENPRVRDVIKHYNIYSKDVSAKNFEGDILVYVTPVSL